MRQLTALELHYLRFHAPHWGDSKLRRWLRRRFGCGLWCPYRITRHRQQAEAGQGCRPNP